jgi:hypothetical protein
MGAGSALMFTNGSTAIDFAPAAAGAGGRSACENCAAEAKRSPGSFASAFMTACAAQSGTPSGRCGGGLVSPWVMMACAVRPANGARPASISYVTHPRL